MQHQNITNMGGAGVSQVKELCMAGPWNGIHVAWNAPGSPWIAPCVTNAHRRVLARAIPSGRLQDGSCFQSGKEDPEPYLLTRAAAGMAARQWQAKRRFPGRCAQQWSPLLCQEDEKCLRARGMSLTLVLPGTCPLTPLLANLSSTKEINGKPITAEQ